MASFNAQMIGLGFLIFVSGVTGLGALRDGELVISLFALPVAAGSLVPLAAVRRRRAAWMQAEGRYEFLAVFEAELREAAGVREDLKVYFLKGLGGVVADVVPIVKELLGRESLATTYERLQSKRRDGSMSETDFRAAIDALFEASRPRRL